jgi:ribosomal protein S18 acetylase RimI-like enzyme
VTQPAHIAWSLRPISQSDLEWAYGLHKEAVGVYVAEAWGWDEAFQRRMFVDRFNLRREVIQVSREDVGVLIVDERPDELYLELVELTSSCQNNRLGTEILRWLLRRAEELRRPLTLHVLRANPRAIRLYEREGLSIAETEQHRFLMRSNAHDRRSV